MKIHHIGYLVKNVEKAAKAAEVLGFTPCADAVYDVDRRIYILFMENGGYRIELVQPDQDSEIYPLMKRYKNSPYHICYDIEDEEMDAAIERLSEQKFTLFKAPCRAVALEGDAAFLMSLDIGMVELVKRYHNWLSQD